MESIVGSLCTAALPPIITVGITLWRDAADSARRMRRLEEAAKLTAFAEAWCRARVTVGGPVDAADRVMAYEWLDSALCHARPVIAAFPDTTMGRDVRPAAGEHASPNKRRRFVVPWPTTFFGRVLAIIYYYLAFVVATSPLTLIGLGVDVSHGAEGRTLMLCALIEIVIFLLIARWLRSKLITSYSAAPAAR